MFAPFRRDPSTIVRPLRATSLEACARIHAASFAQAWTSGEFEQLLLADNVLADAAVSGDGRVTYGFVLSRLAADEAEILTIAVDGARRRGGIGRALMQKHIRRLGDAGVRWLFLEVETGNQAARALYDKLGFVEVGTRPSYYGKADGSRAAALVMRLQLGQN